MPAVFIDQCSHLREILRLLPDLPPHNWLISELVCPDYYDWVGCEKWAEETLFLSDDTLRYDIESRNPLIIWGAFSALPIAVTKEEAYSYELPRLDGNSDYMRNHILPQHPLSFLEIASCDSSYVIISARDSSLLTSLYGLPYTVRDEEADNQKTNANLRRIQTMLRAVARDATNEQANEVQWICRWKLFYGADRPVDDAELLSVVQEVFGQVSAIGYQCKETFWDPFHAD